MSGANRDNADTVATLLVCPDPIIAQAMEAALTLSPTASLIERLSDYPQVDALIERIEGQEAAAVMIDVATARVDAGALLRAVADCGAPVSVVALHRSNDPEVILHCLRGGASEFLSVPFPAADFEQAIQRIAKRTQANSRAQPQAKRRGRLLAMAPVKGGAGCSTLAAALAYQVRAQTQRQVLLADMNLAGGVQSFLLRLRTPYTTIDALRHSSQLDEALWKSLVVCHDGVDVLGAPERPEPPLIEPYPVQETLDFARSIYDYVIADLGSVVDGVGMTAISTADEVNLVCSTDMPSMFLMRRTIPLLEEMGVKRDEINILVNRFDRRAELSTEDMEKIFRASVQATFPDDTASVLRAHREGGPVAESSELGKAICRYVADKLGRQPVSPAGALGTLKQLWGGA